MVIRMNKVNIISKMPERYEMSESFKSLRTNILFSGAEIKVISITSATENEGKSFVSFELAKSLAETGRKVLLLDADLRKSTLASSHTLEKGLFGLSHFLSGQAELGSVIYNTQFPTLDVVFSGPFPPHPVELLGSDKFTGMIMSLHEVYDYIIVDTPPLNSVSDSIVISNNCDGVIIVIAENKVNTHMINSVKANLERNGCHILGAILNFSSGYKVSYSYYYQSEYSGNTNSELPFASLNEKVNK